MLIVVCLAFCSAVQLANYCVAVVISSTQAPVPYFIGIHTSSLATRVGSEMFASCVVVHLDKDKVVSPIFSRVEDYPVDFVLPRLPSRELTVLLETLENVIPGPIGTSQSRSPTSESSQPESNTVNEVELTFGEGPVRTYLACSSRRYT